MEKMTRIKAIKTFFEADGGRKCGMDELRKLTVADKAELAELVSEALGVEISK